MVLVAVLREGGAVRGARRNQEGREGSALRAKAQEKQGIWAGLGGGAAELGELFGYRSQEAQAALGGWGALDELETS